MDLSKLKFFQKQLTRSLITGENPDSATLSKQIIQPILTEVEQVKKGFRGDQKREALDAEPHLRELYDSVAPRQIVEEYSEDYVLQVLKAWKGPVDDPFHFLKDNLFAFFRPSKSAIRLKHSEMQRNMARIMIFKSSRKAFINADASKVLKMFTFQLSLVKETDWTVDKLGDIVKELVDKVKFYDTLENKDKFESAGWTFLRHGLLNGQPGSALVPLMLLFGQHETVHRIRQARKIAGDEEKSMSRAQKAAHSQRHHAKAGSVPEPEARNVTVAIPSRNKAEREGEDPFDALMEGLKGDKVPLQEGPFKSRPPTPPPPRSPPKDPSEVDRSPQFLSKSEFKFGTRHINPLKDAKPRGPAFGDIRELRQYQQSAPSQDSVAPETVQVDAIVGPQEGDWTAPKPRSLQLQDGNFKSQGTRASGVEGQLGVNSQDNDKRNRYLNDSTDAGMAQKSDKVAKLGPFKPEGNEEIADINSHIEHLRALNKAIAFKRAKAQQREEAQKREPLKGSSTGLTRLQMLEATGLGPMRINPVSPGPMKLKPATRRNKAQGSIAGASKEDWQQAQSHGERATASALDYVTSTERTENDTPSDVWGTGRGLDSHGKSQAEAESKAQKKTEKDTAAPAQTEQQLGEKSG